MAINLSEPFIDDIREPIAGDSFNWEGTEPAAAKQSIVIHHSGTNTALDGGTEDGYSIASYHVNHNGWGGIGYHFVITHDSHPGGARVQYVGDLLSWRAAELNQNPGRVGVCLVGNFLQQLPGQNQLRLARELVDFLLAPNMILPSMNFYSQILYHNSVPGQSTDCPGWQSPNFGAWFGYLKGGAFPDALYNLPAPAPTPPPPAPTLPPDPIPTPVPPAPVETPVSPPLDPPGSVLADDYRSTLTAIVPIENKVTTEDAFAADMTGSNPPIPIAKGTWVAVVASFIDNDKTYYRSDKSVASDAKLGSFYGLSAEAFAPTGEIPIPVTVNKNETNGFLLNLSKGLASILGAILRVFGGKKK